MELDGQSSLLKLLLCLRNFLCGLYTSSWKVLTLLNICGGCCNARLRSGCRSSLGGEAEALDLLFVSTLLLPLLLLAELELDPSDELRGLEQRLLLFVLLVGWSTKLDSTPESVEGESVLRTTEATGCVNCGVLVGILLLYLLRLLLTLAEVTETVETVAAIGQWVVNACPFDVFRLMVTPPG